MILFGLVLLAGAGCLSLGVKVQDERGRPVPDAAVALMEIDATAFTDAAGACTFPEVANRPYTVYVSAPGFKEKRQRIEAVDPAGVLVVLQTELVQMEGVEVVGESPNPEPTASSIAFGRDDLARLARGGDAVGLADYAPGVSFPSLAVESGSLLAEDLPSASGLRARLSARGAVSVFGADPDLNAYAFDTIDLPAAQHPLSGRSILPMDLLQGLTFYRGVGPVSHSPAAGGLFLLHPVTDIPSRAEISAGASLPGSLDFQGRFPLSRNAVLTASLRKSFFELYGGLLAGAAGAADPAASDALLGNGDFLLSLLVEEGVHRVRLDAIGFADAVMDWPKGAAADPFAALLSGNQGAAPGADRTGFAVLGGSWSWQPSESVGNTLSAYASLYGSDGRLASFVGPAGPFTTVRSGALSAWTVSASDTAEWEPTDSLAFSGGLRLRCDGLAAALNSVSVIDRSVALLAYPYLQLRWKAGNLLSQSGAGLYWLPLSSIADAGPVLSQEITLFIPPGWSTGLRAAWGAGIYDAASFLARRIVEAGLGMPASSATTFDPPPRAITAEAFLQNDFARGASVGLKPYFAWRYDLRGFSPLAAYADGASGSGTRAVRALTAFEGCAAGCDLSVQAGAGSLLWTAGYTLGLSLVDTRELGWRSANGDARHTLRAQASWRPTADIQAGIGILVLADLPYTPAGGGFHAARDWLPRQRVDLSFRWEFGAAGRSGVVFAGATNILCFLNPVTTATGDASLAAGGAAPFASSIGSAAAEIGAVLRL